MKAFREATEVTIKAGQEGMNSTVSALQEKIELNQEGMGATIRTGQEQMRVELRSGQEETKVTMNSIWSELEEAIRHWVEDVLASTKGRRASARNSTRRLRSAVSPTSSYDVPRPQDPGRDTTKTLVESTQRELEARPAEVQTILFRDLTLRDASSKHI
jgi:hypothetical protein